MINIPRIQLDWNNIPSLNSLLANDGIIIKGFTQHLAKVESTLEGINNSSLKYMDKTGAGIMYPRVYPNLFMSDTYLNEGLKPYSDHLKQVLPNIDEQFGFNFYESFKKLLHSMAEPEGYKVEILNVDGDILSPFSIRSLRPGTGNIPAHTEKYLTGAFAQQLSQSPLDMDGDIWSFFLMVQNAEDGGDLVVYDVAHKASHSKESLAHDNIKAGSHDADNLDNVDYSVTKLQPGDLILFNAGKWWHKITTVQGDKKRITIGGFLGFDKAKSTFYYWS